MAGTEGSGCSKQAGSVHRIALSLAVQHWALSWQNHYSAHHSVLPFLSSLRLPPHPRLVFLQFVTVFVLL